MYFPGFTILMYLLNAVRAIVVGDTKRTKFITKACRSQRKGPIIQSPEMRTIVVKGMTITADRRSAIASPMMYRLVLVRRRLFLYTDKHTKMFPTSDVMFMTRQMTTSMNAIADALESRDFTCILMRKLIIRPKAKLM